MDIGPSIFPLVDLRFFYLSESIHTLTQDSVLNKCRGHFQLQFTVILFKLCIYILIKIISQS